MGKDPAVLLYTSDFLTGTSDLTMIERGQYITLLCQQHQKGRISEKMFKMVDASPDVRGKFEKDEGGYFNRRLAEEIEKRAEHSRKQSERAKKRWDKEKESPADNATAQAAAMPLENAIEDRVKYLKGVVCNNPVWRASKCRSYGITPEEFDKQAAAWALDKAGDEFTDNKHIRNSFNLVLKNYKEKPNGKYPNKYDPRFDKTLNAQEAQEYRKYLKSLGWIIARPPGQGELITPPKPK